MKQAYYHSSIDEFLKTKDDEIIGRLNKGITDYASQFARQLY
jgi:hypothetical protein